MIEEMFGALFHGLWELIKISTRALYHFLKKHPRYACLLPMLVLATYFRFSYVFSSIFLGIDPQDVQINNTLLHGTLILLGRMLTPGNITLGPFYNYLIAPSFFIFGADPLGPALLSGVLFIATIYLIYMLGKQFFNLQAGLFAAGLYAVSPFVLSYQHLSWNIDLLPFFSLLLLWVTFNAAASARPLFYYLAVGYLLGLCLQLHYSALFLVPLIFLYMIITEVIVKGVKFILPFLLHFLQLLVGFAVSFLPFLYYEALKGFPNTKVFMAYLSQIFHPIGELFFLSAGQNFLQFFARLVVNFPSTDNAIYYSQLEIAVMGYFAIFLFVVSLLMLFFVRNRFVKLVLLLWLLLGIFSLSFFKNDVYDSHFSLLYPICFLLVGNFLATIFHFAQQERIKMVKQLISSNAEGETYTMIPVDSTDNKKLVLHGVSIGVSIVLFFVIVLLNLAVLPYRSVASTEKSQIADISKSIIQKVAKKPFNFVLITNPKAPTDPNRYINQLGQLGNKPIQIQHLEIDPQRKSVTDYLYVVCEISCKPLDSEQWNIKGFGDGAIDAQWNVDNAIVYKMVHVIEH